MLSNHSFLLSISCRTSVHKVLQTLSHHNFCSCCDDSDERASASLPCNSKQHTLWLLALKVDRSKVIEILTCSQTSSFRDTLSHHNFCSCGDDSDARASASLPCNSKQHTRWLLALKVDRSKVIKILSSRDICHLIFISTGSDPAVTKLHHCGNVYVPVSQCMIYCTDILYWYTVRQIHHAKYNT